MSYTTADAPTSAQIRKNSAIPHASQIPNDSTLTGDFVDDALNGMSTDVVAAEADIVTNAAGIATNVTNIGTNTSGIATNVTAIGLNTTATAADNDDFVRVVITAVGGSGGATAGTLSVQVSDRAGVAVARAVTIAMDSSLTQFAGPLAATGTAFFDTATTGTLVLGSGALTALITTDATGLYESALADAADETSWFSARTAPGGSASNDAGCVVVECVPDDATWAA